MKSSIATELPARRFWHGRAALAAAMILVAGIGATLAAGSAAAAPGGNPAPSGTSTAAPSGEAAPSGTTTAAAPSGKPDPIKSAQAEGAKQAADQKVATLQQQITAKTTLVQQLTTAASQAESRYAVQLVAQAQAKDAAEQATAETVAANAAYSAARDNLMQTAALAYESGGVVGSSAGLLLAPDPNTLLEQATMQQMVTDQQDSIATAMQQATSARTAAGQRQKAALDQAVIQTDRLDSLRRQADANLVTARSEVTLLQADLVAAKATQKQATAVLTSFLGGWSLSDPTDADALNEHYQEIAKKLAHAKPAPNSAHWTAAMGQTAVSRALQWIGTPYAWAGGTSKGPTVGICAGGAAEGDCHITGFDCSGLALFAWAPYLSMDHLAATQYTQAGSLHPAVDKLLPGDLVFWSSNGQRSGIHHVAIYVGDGNVIQAPQSGDIVRITPLGSVDSGYFGATRART